MAATVLLRFPVWQKSAQPRLGKRRQPATAAHLTVPRIPRAYNPPVGRPAWPASPAFPFFAPLKPVSGCDSGIVLRYTVAIMGKNIGANEFALIDAKS